MHPLLTRRRRATDTQSETSLTRAQLLWCLQALCRSYRTSCDAQALLDATVEPYSWSSLEGAAEKLGLRCSYRCVRLSRIPTESLPCLALLQNPEADDGRFHRPALVVHIDDREVRYFVPGEGTMQRGNLEDLAKLYTGIVLYAAPNRSSEAREHRQSRMFGLRWIPQLLK
jgi:ABC-type bacteriocin/lantibiotic exporter with double-glycine peptidase domain